LREERGALWFKGKAKQVGAVGVVVVAVVVVVVIVVVATVVDWGGV
jgi:hypothetical protein